MMHNLFPRLNLFAILLLLSGICFANENNNGLKVETASYRDLAFNVTHSLGGVVPALQDSNISAQISAIISQFHVDTGYEVKKGDLLVTLDCSEKQLLLDQARAMLSAEQAQLAHAKKQFSQARTLDKQGNISKEIYNQREAEENRLKATVKSNEAAMALAQINVDRCQIKAPFDGYITSRHASIGELTQPGTALLQLVSKTNNIVEAKINNRLLNSFTQGINHQFVFGNESYPLKIEHILPVLDTTTRNHITRLSFVDQQAATGSVGRIEWQDADTSLPSTYVVLRDNKYGILIAEKNSGNNVTARFIAINNAIEGQPARVILDDDVQIITKGRYNVKHGDLLIINNETTTDKHPQMK